MKSAPPTRTLPRVVNDDVSDGQFQTMELPFNLPAESALVADLVQFLEWKKESAAAEARVKPVKERIMKALSELEADESGSTRMDLEEPVAGFAAVRRERYTSRTEDTDMAMHLLRERGAYDSCVMMVPAIDEDAVYAALQKGLLSEEDLERMYPLKVNYRLMTVKA